jgi:CRP/FNR family transcriptional regulator, nitrogen oxide reductase regulator
MSLDRSLIASLPPFQGLDNAALDEILSSARSVRYAKDQAIFRQEAEAHTFFLLLNGHARVVKAAPDGSQMIVRYINRGELFGIAAALGRTTYPADAIAAVECVVVVWPSGVWADLAARFPAFAASAYGTVGARLQETQQQVMALSTEQVEQRVASALLRLVKQAGRRTADGIEIDFPISRQDIAEMTGTTLHTVSRLLSAWESQGVIASGRQRVTVTDPHALASLAERRQGP